MLARLGLIVITPLLAAAVLVTPQLVGATYSGRETISDVQLAASGLTEDDVREVEVEDVYGNEVSAAVATYKFDATGTLYELHSPQTELPRLASPKS